MDPLSEDREPRTEGGDEMLNRCLPETIYRHLAGIYLVTAMLVFLAPLSALKWIPIGALMIAAGLTLLLRHTPDRATPGRRGRT